MATTREVPLASPAADAQSRRTPRSNSYDLVIIGGGSAGLSAATIGALLGVRVLLLDREKLGGECLYTGCVPSKALLHVARVAREIRMAHTLGLSARIDPVDLGAVADQVQRVIRRVYTRDSPGSYEKLGVEVAFGEVRFVSPRDLTVNGHTLRARAYIVCTGSHATTPNVPGLEAVGYLTNDSVFDVRQLPAALTVVGGGPIGVEMAQAFARLGSRVTILQRPDRLLPKEEPDASSVIRRQLEAEGVIVRTNAAATGFERRAGLKIAHVQERDGTAYEVPSDEVLVALGRTPNVAGLDLEAAGVTYRQGEGIKADSHLRTSNKRIFVAGDVKGAPFFTHAAAQQARIAVRNAITPARTALDERVLPWATFTDPEVARVGLTEQEARQRHGNDVRVYSVPFSEIDRADAEEATAGFVKLVSTGKGQLLGAHLVGLNAGEYVNELALAMREHISLSQIASTVHVYPTLALAIQTAAGNYAFERTRDGSTPRLVRWYLRLFR
ncbi:MAG TPA: FAD-dependent oxidoreductase [Ktedonobacterales bacterium]|jgi:pyruvate/2-oxoglutarate dehydrogenase complex dihydrolipoamide dehydrogenase (E3) component|nr:FAD-dependent oxidoreductase [Ktedonobacterales bacterium]